jgi:hypothetical protein
MSTFYCLGLRFVTIEAGELWGTALGLYSVYRRKAELQTVELEYFIIVSKITLIIRFLIYVCVCARVHACVRGCVCVENVP